jgi:hypothetical protein
MTKVEITKANPTASISMTKNGFNVYMEMPRVYTPKYDEWGDKACGCTNQAEVDAENARRAELCGTYSFETIDALTKFLKDRLV